MPTRWPTRYGDAVDVRELLAVLWRRKALFLVVLILELAATYGFLVTTPKKYTATATLAVSPKPSLINSPGNFATLQATVGQLAKSTDVLSGAMGRTTVRRPLKGLRENVSGSLVQGTVLVRIKVIDKVPADAARLADAVANELPLHDPSGGLFVYSQVESARIPDVPSSPKVKLILAIGVVLGVALATAAALLRDNATRRVDTAEDVQELTGASVLARVPRPRDASKVAALDADVGSAASFRALRIALEFVAARDPLPAIVVASAVRDDTEGWLAVNLAVSLAQVQHRVLLVDGNLLAPGRHPVLARPGGAGLIELLRGEDAKDAIQPGPVPGLYVLPAGSAAGAPTAELVETRFGEHMLGWVRDYDVVVVDAPAVTVSDDARIMAVVGAVLLAVPIGRVAPRTLREVSASLRAVSSRVAGAVLVGGAGAAGTRSRASESAAS
jgi:Mrp family chromosome partitioning ATPase